MSTLREMAEELARAEAAATLRGEQKQFYAQLRDIFGDEEVDATPEAARVRECLEAGVPPYGPL